MSDAQETPTGSYEVTVVLRFIEAPSAFSAQEQVRHILRMAGVSVFTVKQVTPERDQGTSW